MKTAVDGIRFHARLSIALSAALVCVCLAAPCALAQEAPSLSRSSFSLAQLTSDYDYVRRIVNTVNPLAFADRKALKAVMNRQETELRDGMGEIELFRVLAPVVAAIQCGHSSLSLPRGYEEVLRTKGRYLPFLLRAIGDVLYVLDPLGAQDLPPGARITRINGRTAKEILDALLEGLSSDGGILSRKYVVLNGGFNDQYLTLIESPPRFVVEVVDPRDGSLRTVTMDAVSRGSLEALSVKAGRPYMRSALPAYEYSFPVPGTAVLTVRTFVLDGSHPLPGFRGFLEEFFTTVREQGIGTLILDLRGNWGGDPNASAALYGYLIKEPSPYFAEGTPYYPALVQNIGPEASAFQGDLRVLIDGASFSSTGHLCSLLRFHGLATFIGEETGGTYTCTDGSRDFVLPATSLVFRSSTREFRVAVTGLTPGKGIAPDHEAVPTIDDVLRGKDAPMELALHITR